MNTRYSRHALIVIFSSPNTPARAEVLKPKKPCTWAEICINMASWDQGRQGKEYLELYSNLSSIQHSLSDFIVEFINEKDFKKLVENMSFPLRAYGHIAMTGYFSEGMAQTIIEIETVRTRACKIQILSPTLGKSPRDKENIKALRKLQDMGVEVRIHSRLHCRMIIAYSNTPKITGVLVLGSFDPNNEGMTATQRNAGIKTMHPDLVASAVKYFDEIWKEPRDSLPLNDVYPE